MFRFADLISPARPTLMGIVNVTPDSFSDGTVAPDAAAAHARQLVREGARILDLGAEASSFFRPGVAPVPADEQVRRLALVLARLADVEAMISVDTRSAEVARVALNAHAAIINDISAGEHDPEMLGVVAQRGAALILMHITPGYPATPAADDPDILATVRDYLLARARAALAAGIRREAIALDPGIGFGKTMADNWRLALRAPELAGRLDGFPLVIGASRKRFLETPPPADVQIPPIWPSLFANLKSKIKNQKSKIESQPRAAHPRDPASAALALTTPGMIHRLHDIALPSASITSRRAADPL